MRISVVEKVLSWVETRGDIVAVADPQNSLTYKELKSAIIRTAKYFKDRTLKESECVLIQATNCVDFVVGLFAIHYAGGIAVPIDGKLPEENIKSILSDTNARFIIADSITAYGADTIPLTGISRMEENGKDIELSFPKLDQYADVLFTTGTTGIPKGVLFNHLNLVGVVENLIGGSHMEDGTVYLVYGPLNHAFAIRKIYYTLFCGCTVVLMNGLIDLKLFYSMLDKYKVTATHLLPAAARIVLKLTSKQLAQYSDQLVMVESGTAPYPEEDMDKLRETLPNTRLYFGYGCSESDCITKLEFSKHPDKIGSVGMLTVNSEVKLVDAQKNEIHATKDNPGFIACKSIVNMVGYWKEPELTAEVLQDGFFYTNDLGYIDEDGYLYVLGRVGDVINVGGIKVSAKEIEDLATKFPAIEDCAVIPVADPISTQTPKLFIQISNGTAYDEMELRDYLRSSLETYKVPKYIEVIDKIPRNFIGKIQKSKLS